MTTTNPNWLWSWVRGLPRRLARYRHPLAFVAAVLVAVGPDLLVALDGRELSVGTVARALAGVLIAAFLNGRLVPVLRRFYPRAAAQLDGDCAEGSASDEPPTRPETPRAKETAR